MSVSGSLIDDLLNGNDDMNRGSFEYYKEGVLADKATGEFNEREMIMNYDKSLII